MPEGTSCDGSFVSSVYETISENAFDSAAKVQFGIHANRAERFIDDLGGMDSNERVAAAAKPKRTF